MAEMERKRESKNNETSITLDDERKKKLEKLQLLKAKLAELEQEEKPKSTPTEAWQPPKGKPADTEGDKYLDQIDQELSQLEQNFATVLGDIENQKIKKQEQQIEKAANVFTGEIKPDLTDIDSEMAKLQSEIDLEQAKAAVVISIFDQLCEEHGWLKEPQYGFMYTIPNKKKKKKDFESWLDDWNKVLFDYARIASKHIVYSKKLMSEKPWSEFRDRTTAIHEISDYLVKNKVAEWLDKKKEKLRVYWRSLEAWADTVIQWARDNAYTESLFIEDLQGAGQDFSSLPTEDLNKIINIIAKQGEGEKHKLKGGKLAITIKM